MKKLKTNTNNIAKPVGVAAHGDPEKNNGITLIALIITIIVMLILVAVTINVALNGGLIEKARTAGEQTQKQVEKEELITIAIGAYSSKNDSVTLSELTGAISTEKYEYDSGKSNEDKYVVKGKKSGTIWQIDLKTAEVTEYKENLGIYYKIAYVYSNTNDGLIGTHKMYFINDSVVYYSLIYSGTMDMEISGFMTTDTSQMNFAQDYESFSQQMDGENVTFEKTDEALNYSPQLYGETGIYTNALYTLDGTLTLLPYNIQITGENMYRCSSSNPLPVGDLIDITTHFGVTVGEKSLTWTDGNTYYLVEANDI